MLLDKMYKYEMDPTRRLGATERTLNAGRMDGRMDEWTDGPTNGRMDRRTDGRSETNIPPTTLLLYKSSWTITFALKEC